MVILISKRIFGAAPILRAEPPKTLLISVDKYSESARYLV